MTYILLYPLSIVTIINYYNLSGWRIQMHYLTVLEARGPTKLKPSSSAELILLKHPDKIPLAGFAVASRMP